ncbi:MAG: histidine kinase dimerization/phospho-acceptor domain-containing protein, partial [Verrucomicrobiota bacterium]|nr:histidine kinase dimerization/phospho-acceptor domain-containing protein [Verrucomicrobiota bacterium]
MRLSTKLLLTTCISPALIWLVGVYVVKASQDQLRAAIQTAAMAEVRSMQEEIDRLLRARTNTWEKFSKDEEVIATLVKSNEMLRKKEGLVEEIALVWSDEERRRNLPDGVLDRALSRELGSTVDKMTELSGGTEIFHGVMLTNAFGGIVAQSSPTAGYLHDGSVWWQEAKASSPYIGDVTVGRDGNRQEEISISFCLRLNDQEGEFVGIMRVEINLQEVLDVVDSYARRGGRDRGMVLLNSEAQLIRIGGRGRTRTLSDGRRYLVPNESGRLEGTQVLEKDASGREQVYTYAVPPEEGIVSSLGWLAVHTAEADTLLAPVRQLRNNVILAAAMATILGVAVMLWVVFPVSRRMKRLVEATKQIGKGTNEAPISVAGHDELSELSHEFNQMRVRLGEAQEKLREAMERAKEASKAKGDFLANMSHEIRTPMNAIMGITELTLGTDLTEEQRHYQILVEQSAQALLMLLNDILDYSKIEAGKLEME